MKRAVLFFAVLAFFAMGCSKPSEELAGNWQLDFAQTFAQVPGDYGVDHILGLRRDGSFTWTYSEVPGISSQLPMNASGTGTWNYVDNVLTLSADGNIVYSGYIHFSYDRNTITLPGDPHMIFNKL